MKRIGILMLGVFFCFVSGAWPQAQTQYQVIIFDVPWAGTGSGQGTTPSCINPVGQVAGWYVDSSNVNHGFLRSPDGSITSFDPPNSVGTIVYGNNLEGAITGWYWTASDWWVNHGFVRAPDGTFTTFDAPDAGNSVGADGYYGTEGTYGDSINLVGEIVGHYIDTNGVTHGLVRSNDGKITEFDAHGKGIGPIADTETDTCNGINQVGVIAGTYHDPQWFAHPYVRTPDGTFTTFLVPGSVDAYTSAINLEGAITGGYFQPADVYHGYVRFPDGRITKFDDSDAGNATYQGTAGSGINVWGEIVGIYFDANNVWHGFIRSPYGKLTNFDCPNTTTVNYQSTVLAVNSPTGAIMGWCTDQNNVNHGLLLLPKAQ